MKGLELLDDEKLIQELQPSNKVWKGSIYFIVVSSHMFLIWSFMVFGFFSSGAVWNVESVLVLSIPGVFILYAMFGRFFAIRFMKKRTYYYITNQRIIFYESWSNRTRYLYRNAITSCERKRVKGDIGTLIFNKEKNMYSHNYLLYFSGLDFMLFGCRKYFYVFKDIENAAEIQDLLKLS